MTQVLIQVKGQPMTQKPVDEYRNFIFTHQKLETT